MNKKRIEIIITAVLILIFIFAWANTIKVIKKKISGKTSPPDIKLSTEKLKPASVQFEKETYVPKREEKSQDDNLVWVRCPFSGKTYTGGLGTQDLKLAGIIWDEREPLAIINDGIVKVGDTVGTNKVIAIKSDRVILNDGNKNIEIRLEQ